MTIIFLLIKQIITMLLYMAIGVLLFRGKKITKQGSGELANLLVWLVIPAVIVKSYCAEPTAERILALGQSTLAAGLALLLAILVSHILFRRRPLDNFAAAFSNAGFLGIPLVTATLGSNAVFYITPFIAFLNILQWVYGVAVLTGKRMSFSRSTFLNPVVLGMVTGLVLFFTGLGARLPTVVTGALQGISGLNAPLAMVILGVYLAQADLRTLWRDGALYRMSAARLLMIPALTLLLLRLIGLEQEIADAILIAASAPVGANIAVYAQLHGKDYIYASKTVVFSTLLSLVTMPLILLLAQSLG